MTADGFRAEMMERIRAFDKWAFADQLANPDDYVGYTFEDWFAQFMEYTND